MYDTEQYHEAVSHGRLDRNGTTVPNAFERTKKEADELKPNPHVPKFQDHQIKEAIKSYEEYHKLPRGSTTVEQVENSSAGIRGWYQYEPTPSRKPKQKSERRAALNCMTHKYTRNYLAAASKAKKEAYKIRALTPEETESNRKHSAYFEAKLPTKIDEAKVNQTVEKYADWVENLLDDKDDK
eukprot:SAG11_NODE_3788_length_2225_cov_2.018815_2_plen_183_part_00